MDMCQARQFPNAAFLKCSFDVINSCLKLKRIVFVPLMPSNDCIVIQKYYEGTTRIINESVDIGRLLGIIDATNLQKPNTELRRRNKIQTIHSSLAIEGNSLSEEQITDILDNKVVLGPSKDILEVKSAITVYDSLSSYDAFDEASYKQAHKQLMTGLIEWPGKYRTKEGGILKGEQVAHMAPPAWNVDNLMKQLFNCLIEDQDNLIIKSCVFHYEMEFIHPFIDGNGRMGRLWQTVILMRHNPVFEYLPIESEIKQNQQEYYDVLAAFDKSGMSTVFIEYMLDKIRNSLSTLLSSQRVSYNDVERIKYFSEINTLDFFTRKDYMDVFKNISTATATRDLRKGLEMSFFEKTGSDRLTKYRIKKS